MNDNDSDNDIQARRAGRDFDAWLSTAPGKYLVAWEQAQLDRALTDVFGYHAVQLGVPALRALRANRMPHRWLAVEGLSDGAPTLHTSPEEVPRDVDHAALDTEAPSLDLRVTRSRVDVLCQFEGLPFKSQSLDLVVLPHTLEWTRDPHEVLREVARVLMPNGRVVISGFNSASLWGMRQRLGNVRQRLGGTAPSYLPRGGEVIGYRRLRDWLRLLSIDIEGGRFGCYAAPVRSEAWLQRTRWMDTTGDRWWPVFGAVYFVVAVKRVRGMRLVGLVKQVPKMNGSAPAVATQRMPKHDHDNTKR